TKACNHNRDDSPKSLPLFFNVFLYSIRIFKSYTFTGHSFLCVQVKLSDRVVSTNHGLLIRSVHSSDQGVYYCLATENGFKRTLAKIRLQILSEALVSALSNNQSPWGWAASLHPKALVSNPMRGDLGKLKPLLDHRKSRNRRNHLREE
uniref:Immunoglobulin V-set domain-containing protein n=1 Tax=Sinocyclocheilus anshuiensis TaxID=1608454 RepID=A0A671L7J5_9TELE